jgi:UDP-N-acetylglucosamine transferase subunit ALG13
VIFVTVGSDVPFSRLVKQVDLWSKENPGHRIFAQVGRLKPADYVPQAMEWTEMVSADEFDRHCVEARLIVAHAGMGSIISALQVGKPIVILPRSGRLRETRNDHQFATAKRFSNRPGIFVAWAENDLGTAIGQAAASIEEGSLPPLSEFAPPDFTDRLRKSIWGGDREA